jgi:PAS domain S-box-containing protein
MSFLDFERFFDLSLDMLCIANIEGYFVRINASFQRCLGWSIADLTSRPFVTLIHPDDQAATFQELTTIIAGSPVFNLENRYRSANGDYRTIQWTATQDATTGLLYAIGRDVTDTRTSEADLHSALERERQSLQALRVSEARLEEAQHMAKIGCWELNLSTNLLWWSDEIYHIFELDLVQFGAPHLHPQQIVHPDDLEAVNWAYTELLINNIPYEMTHRLLMPDGRIKYVQEQGHTIYDDHGQPIRSIGTMQDISEHKRSENELLRKEAAIAASLNGIAIADLAGKLTYVNRAFLNMWGYDAEAQVLGRSAISFWGAPEAAGQVIIAIQATGAWSGELSAVRTDGSERTFQVNASLFSDESGMPIGMVASFLDSTERKQSEDALRLRDKVISTSLNGITITDPIGRIVYVNPSFLRIYGYETEADIIGKSTIDFIEAATARQFVREIQAQGFWQGELVVRRKDGTTIDALVAANTVFDANGTVINLVSSIIDISEAKRLQAQFLQAQKMESVGRLAGGVAHDFNNLLTVMKGYLELALMPAHIDDLLRHDLVQVNNAVDSASSLTQQMLAFSRQQIIAPQVMNLNTVVVRTQKILQRLLGEDIELRAILSEDISNVLFDPNQSEQIIINLAVNARDAMPNGGKLTIETAMVRLEEAYTHTHMKVQPGEYVMIAISDTGLGMSADVKSHLFEPFFTTKEQGKGTGLGLAMVYGAISQNGGRIEVYSELGEGTTFKIYLPQAEQGDVVARIEQSQVLPHGTQTIILVEDDEDVRQLATRLLERQGYLVYAFPDGMAAVNAVIGMQMPLHLLITDVIMPGMNGRVLADRIKALRPTIKVLYTSGYTANVIVHHGVLKEGIEFLPKPYSIRALAQRVREVLDKPVE